MAKTAFTATWTTLDPATLPTPIAKQYANYKAAYVEMKAERKAFEDALSDQLTLPPGKRAVFGYNFGKLSAAIVDAAATPKASPSAGSLADFIASQTAQGKRV